MSYGMLCNECGSLKERAKDADKGAITILMKYLEEVTSKEAKEDIDRIIESTKDLVLRKENAKKEKELEYQKEIRHKEKMGKIVKR